MLHGSSLQGTVHWKKLVPVKFKTTDTASLCYCFPLLQAGKPLDLLQHACPVLHVCIEIDLQSRDVVLGKPLTHLPIPVLVLLQEIRWGLRGAGRLLPQKLIFVPGGVNTPISRSFRPVQAALALGRVALKHDNARAAILHQLKQLLSVHLVLIEELDSGDTSLGALLPDILGDVGVVPTLGHPGAAQMFSCCLHACQRRFSPDAHIITFHSVTAA
mmetsp:Transcript_120613/g.352271  ORF Transcript_120613/g.352271 Transcript_120613/m.352271 type:complete len:216 (-) Transcript_120613:403-1050(-)